MTTNPLSTNRFGLTGWVLGLNRVAARPVPAVSPVVREWVIVCLSCQLDVPGYADEAEAGYLAGVHNDLHHGSRPEAFTVAVSEPVQGGGAL